MPNLRGAIKIIHSDPAWWQKMLGGGALWLSLVGWPFVEGHQLESIENSQRGFPTPLPRWTDFGTKGLVGFFAIIIDFFYFVLPVLGGSIVLFCGTVAVELAGAGTVGYIVPRAILVLTALYMLAIWVAGASAVAKQRYVAGGDFADILSSTLVREILSGPDRALYVRARVLSTPAYLLALGLLALAYLLLRWNLLVALLVGWLAFSTLVYARLVTIQLYLDATRTAERRRFDVGRANGKRRVET